MKSNPTVLTFPNPAALAQEAARRWLDDIAAARERPYLVALSGGRITHPFFEAVVAQNHRRAVPLSHVYFFWADERCVPPTDKESNFRIASELLLAPMGIRASRIYRLAGEDDPGVAAREASAELLRLAPVNAEGQPVLDLVLLGMGEDGHVASLFPNADDEVLYAKSPFLVIHDSPKPPPTRLSLSYAALVAAHKVWVLASGAGKEQALKDSLAPVVSPLTRPTPLRRLISWRTGTEIFTDIQSARDAGK